MRDRRTGERGQIAIPLFFVMVVLMTAGFWFFQVGRASLLQARVTTAADAGALAGGEELKRQYIEYLETYALSGAPFIPNIPLIGARALDYTARNDGVITSFSVDPIRLRVTVEAANTQSMDGAFGMSDRGDRGSFEATAQVTIAWSFGAPGLGGFGGGGGGGAGNTAGFISELDPEFAEAVRQLDEAMGGTLQISSGYRSAAEQAATCASVPADRPCAPPGRSMHQYGLAIDVSNWDAAQRTLAQHPEINMCWPNIPRDPFHFSFGDGRECGGTRGSGSGGNGLFGAGQLFGGGGVGSLGTFDVHLVDDSYGFGGLGGGSFPGLPNLPGLNGNGGLGDPNDPRSWQALIECESGGNPRAINPTTGSHFGLFQFDIPTWQSVGGTGNPIDASPEEQFMRARMLYAMRGWQPWECATDILGWPNRWPGT